MPARFTSVYPLLGLLLCLVFFGAGAEEFDEDFDADFDTLSFDDAPLQEAVRHPSWFRLSFLDLRDDLNEAIRFDKRGLIVVFGQDYCPYCQKLMEVNFTKRDIVRYTRKHFDVVAINIHGDKTVTDFSGLELTEKEFAELEGTNFTPTLIFYNRSGEEVLRLRGYYPPYKFHAALEYVADGHYRNEAFRDYLERADPTFAFEQGELNEEPFFSSPPHALDRSKLPAQRPLAVFFEQGNCHACDVLHSGPLKNPEILKRLEGFETVQLDLWGKTPVITPGGERMSEREWGERLGLFYTPTIIFYDEQGKEILRVDSVIRFFRLKRVLDYISSGVYRKGITIQRWRRIEAGNDSL